MKTIRIVYWSSTILVAGFMILSSISNVASTPDALAFFASLGYPAYIVPFLGWAKIVGCIGLLIPLRYRIKEWAYAGLLFDLVGAFYSVTMSFGFTLPSTIILLPIVLLLVSYVAWHRMAQPQGQS